MKTKKVKWIVGDIIKIELKNNDYCFGRVLDNPLIAFYDLKVKQLPSEEEILQKPILFKICVMNYAVTSGAWEVIGHMPLEKNLEEPVTFFMQDIISKKTYFYLNSEKTPATLEQCEKLERMAVWDPKHVEDRLRDHYLGVPNKWVESLRVKK